MTDTAIEIQLNPAEETIQCGHLSIHYLTTGEHSNGSIEAFEMTVPGAQGVTAPAHSHNHYEETMYGIEGVRAFCSSRWRESALRWVRGRL